MARKVKKKKLKRKKSKIVVEDSDYLIRFQLFDLLRKLGLKTPPTWFGGMSEAQFISSTNAAMANFGTPDFIMIDKAALKTYKKAFGL